MVTLLDAVTILSHYCLFDFNSQQFRKTITDSPIAKTFKGLFQMYCDFPNSSVIFWLHYPKFTKITILRTSIALAISV